MTKDQVAQESQLRSALTDPRVRRQFLIDIYERRISLPGLDPNWAAALLAEMFPNLRGRGVAPESQR